MPLMVPGYKLMLFVWRCMKVHQQTMKWMPFNLWTDYMTSWKNGRNRERLNQKANHQLEREGLKGEAEYCCTLGGI